MLPRSSSGFVLLKLQFLDMQYEILDPDKFEIRLLAIKSCDDGRLSCSLEKISLKEQPKYKALSYCWGDERDKLIIFVNNHPMDITINLNCALDQLQHEYHGHLWIDAICINQQDPVERSKQVQMMTEIYSQATEVIVWLGPAADDSDKAIDLMQTFIAEAPDSILAPGGAPLSFAEAKLDRMSAWMALSKLFARPYWQRTWILQEIALAKHVVIRCGEVSADWRGLRGTVQIRRRWLKARDLGLPPIFDGNSERIDDIVRFRPFDIANVHKISLTAALLAAKDQLVKDARDKIYGILGIANDASCLVPHVSYNIRVEDVFTSLTIAVIENRSRLDLICFKSPYGKRLLTLPSWVIDPTTPCFDASTKAALVNLSYGAKLKPVQDEYRCQVSFGPANSSVPQTLKVSAFMLGYVDGLGAVKLKENAQADPDTDYGVLQPETVSRHYQTDVDGQIAIYDAMTQRFRSDDLGEANARKRFAYCWADLTVPQRQKEFQSLLAFEWSMEDSELKFQGHRLEAWTLSKLPQPVVARSAKLMARLQSFNVLNDQQLQNEQDTRSEYVASQETHIIGARDEDADDASDVAPVTNMLNNMGFSGSTQALYQHLSWTTSKNNRPMRRLLITSKGEIGNIHPQARRGDWICLVQGSTMPIVLRPSQNRLRVVGDAYIYGWVEGYSRRTAAIKQLQAGKGNIVEIS